MAIRMKMKQEKMRKIGITSALGLVVLVILGLYGASNYMLNYSLYYPKEERMTAEHWKNRMKNECPWMIGWMDSVYQHHCVKDTFVTMPSGYKAHAIYLYAPKTTEKTAVVVHGYQVRSEGMLHIAYLYNHDMGYNVLLPDLYGHGESEGDHIQMGWKDRWDVIIRPVIHRINTIIHHKRDGNLPLAHQFQLFPCPDDKTVKSRRFQPGTMCFKIFLCPIAENMRHYQKTLLVCLMAARYPFVPLFGAKFSAIQIDGADFRYG